MGVIIDGLCSDSRLGLLPLNAALHARCVARPHFPLRDLVRGFCASDRILWRPGAAGLNFASPDWGALVVVLPGFSNVARIKLEP